MTKVIKKSFISWFEFLKNEPWIVKSAAVILLIAYVIGFPIVSLFSIPASEWSSGYESGADYYKLRLYRASFEFIARDAYGYFIEEYKNDGSLEKLVIQQGEDELALTFCYSGKEMQSKTIKTSAREKLNLRKVLDTFYDKSNYYSAQSLSSVCVTKSGVSFRTYMSGSIDWTADGGKPETNLTDSYGNLHKKYTARIFPFSWHWYRCTN